MNLIAQGGIPLLSYAARALMTCVVGVGLWKYLWEQSELRTRAAFVASEGFCLFLFFVLDFGLIFTYSDYSFLLLVPTMYGFAYSCFPRDAFGFASSLDPYYFAFTTMSSVGFGDLAPRTPLGKLLVMTQQAALVTGVVAHVDAFLAANLNAIVLRQDL